MQINVLCHFVHLQNITVLVLLQWRQFGNLIVTLNIHDCLLQIQVHRGCISPRVDKIHYTILIRHNMVDTYYLIIN
jgi:hypothetical protein